MKKSAIIAATVATLMAGTVAADNTVYGKVRLFEQLSTVDAVAPGTDAVGVGNYSSRIGFKGSEDLGNGMSSIYQYETAVDDTSKGTTATRLLYAGVKGDFGQVAIGTQWTPSYVLVRGAHDPFNSPVGANVFGGNFAAGSRTADALSYVGKFGDVSVAGAVVSNDGSDTFNDATDLAVSMPIGPVTIGVAVQMTDLPKGDGTDQWSAVNVGWADGAFAVDLGLFQTDLTDDWLALTGSFKTDSGKIILQLEDNGTDNQTTVAYHHKMSKKTVLFAEISAGDIGTEASNVGIMVNF